MMNWSKIIQLNKMNKKDNSNKMNKKDNSNKITNNHITRIKKTFHWNKIIQ